MIYEIYSREGIPSAIEHRGSLEDVLNLIGLSEVLIGKNNQGKREALFVRKGENVLHVCEAEDDWSRYIRVSDGKPSAGTGV